MSGLWPGGLNFGKTNVSSFQNPFDYSTVQPVHQISQMWRTSISNETDFDG
jgi:hypothetical protein